MILKFSKDLAPVVSGVLRQVSARLRELLPGADFHHVGSVAIPSALTKGDIDVLLRVGSSEPFSKNKKSFLIAR